MPDQREDILKFIKQNGPVLPVNIAKFVNTNILFASAMLSELVDRKLLKITHAAIGGSPLYYLSGQEALMDERLSKALSGKEKEAYNLIKENKVLREIDLEPWQRVAIKSLVDFTKSFNVATQNNTEVFWKHHLVTDQEAELIVRKTISDINLKQVQEQPIERQQILEQTEPAGIKKELIEELKEELEIQQELTENQEVWQPNLVINDLDTLKAAISKPRPIQAKELKKRTTKKSSDDFYQEVTNYLNKNDIKVIKEEIIKKDKEFDFLVNIPSPLGGLRYFLKAKSKPSVNEADISMAYSDAQVKNLPVILLIKGKVNKKALSSLNTKFNGKLILKEI